MKATMFGRAGEVLYAPTSERLLCSLHSFLGLKATGTHSALGNEVLRQLRRSCEFATLSQGKERKMPKAVLNLPAQESLFAPGEAIHPWETKGIFSEHFLRSRLSRTSVWPSDEFVQPIYDYLSELWRRKYIGLALHNEEVTRREFLDKVFERLGFAYLPNLDLPKAKQRQTPDYLLFENEDTKDRVFNEDTRTQYQAAIALSEAKKVKHPLDQVSKHETPGKFPHQQVRDYLSNAADETGRAFFRWAVLTNGNVWRLYCRDAHPSSYFQFNLAGPEAQVCSYADFKVFVALFQPAVFIKDEEGGRCQLDDIREEAIDFQNTLEENLRRRVFTVLEDLANGFWGYKENGLRETDLPLLYDKCLIFLYRLLFVLYAESRGLLPVKLSGPGANKEYRIRYSLRRLNHRLKNRADFHSDAFTELYDELLKLFHLINGDKPQLNKSCDVPRYNGGLFDPKAHPELERWRIGEKSLGKVLRDLIFSAGHTEGRKQPELEYGPIDYADLEVRQLGDIYEGLLGGHFELVDGRLALMSERGQLQVTGTFYTPDWVVRLLVEKTSRPLIDEIEQSEPVRQAIKKGRKNNSFALAVLKLNILDNAMGSGHFLVRATEWLADQIVYHPTTEFKVKEIARALSQEQAEISYWRRRVVEACIYGVDLNPLAVELSKLSLWLTCIAINEPLNFLDHHLRTGNSLVGARVEEFYTLPDYASKEQIALSYGRDLSAAVSEAIKEIEQIEGEASTDIEIVKRKEGRWRDEVLERLRPFKEIGNLWIAAASGMKLNEAEYVRLATGLLKPPNARTKDAELLKTLQSRTKGDLDMTATAIKPFHWELEFPDAFYNDDGSRKENPGFDAILGNPPYISTQTSSGFDFRSLLERRFSFVDDLYVHFVFQGFSLLRQGGMFGYIISDTFFTLSTKERLRELLQQERLMILGQCDPFRATVDAAIFVAQKAKPTADDNVIFVQARYPAGKSAPDKELVELAEKPMPPLLLGNERLSGEQVQYPVYHGSQGCLRIHRSSIEPYRHAVKKAFFEPTATIVRLYNKFNKPLKELTVRWWEKVKTSEKFNENRDEILRYHSSLKAGAVSLVGLIAEGGQGMRTANNGRFLGYLEGTLEAKGILERRNQLLAGWMENPKLREAVTKLLEEHENNLEEIVEPLKSRFDALRELGLKRGEIYRIVPRDALATQEDFVRAYESRRSELEERWSQSKKLSEPYKVLKAKHSDDFYALFQALVEYATKSRLRLSNLGLRSGEFYYDEANAPRIATIYNGLTGKRVWVPFRKGDPEGNKWTDIEPLFIRWNSENVAWLSSSAEARWQGQNLFLTPGVTYTLLGNHVALKAKLQPACVFDAGASRLSPVVSQLTPHAFLAILNSNVFSFIVRKFIKNTAAYEINDLRMAPIVIPSPSQMKTLDDLARHAVQAKELELRAQEPPSELVQYCRQLVQRQKQAPNYLQPDPQVLLFASAQDCLTAIELAVQWEVEKLYGVEGLGRFEEF